MTADKLQIELAKLGYNDRWIDSGILTIEVLNCQLMAFDKNAETNTEHFRYATFLNYLKTRNGLNDLELENYLSITLGDNDQTMAGSATAALFDKVDLTDQQFYRVIVALRSFGDWSEKLIIRHQLLRALRTVGLNVEIFEKCISSGDSVIHKYLLAIADSTQLQILSVKGGNKAIRNIAEQKLKHLAI
jgi:hypothetical protein